MVDKRHASQNAAAGRKSGFARRFDAKGGARKPAGRLALVRADGVVLARSPEDPAHEWKIADTAGAMYPGAVVTGHGDHREVRFKGLLVARILPSSELPGRGPGLAAPDAPHAPPERPVGPPPRYRPSRAARPAAASAAPGPPAGPPALTDALRRLVAAAMGRAGGIARAAACSAERLSAIGRAGGVASGAQRRAARA